MNKFRFPNRTQLGIVHLLAIIFLGFLAIATILLLPQFLSKSFDIRSRAANGLNAPMGVNWHMGAWYNATTGINGYNWDGLRKDLDDMKKGNVLWVRLSMNKATQSSCSPTGFYTLAANELDTRGMKGLATVSIPNATTTTATDAEVSAFTSWLQTMVSCYKTRYHDWEIGNEPNLHYFWNIDENTTDNAAYALSVSYYVKYLKAAYLTIKAIYATDGTANNVILGGLSQWKDERFMDELTKQGAGAYIDSMNLHPYSTTPDGSISELSSFKAKMAIDPLMANKPIWITEVGVSTDSTSNFHVASEQAKADYLTQTFLQLTTNGITVPIFWYDWDHDKCTNCGAGYGLIFTDRTAPPYNTTYYPAYYANKNLSALSSTPTPTISSPTLTPTPIPTNIPTPTPSGDTTPPSIMITNPADGAMIKKGTSVTFSATATDNVAVARVEFSVNNSIPSECSDTAAPYTCIWNVPNKPNVSYTIMAKAYDSSGNTSSSTIKVTSIR